jgi:hypothetical protein
MSEDIDLCLNFLVLLQVFVNIKLFDLSLTLLCKILRIHTH